MKPAKKYEPKEADTRTVIYFHQSEKGKNNGSTKTYRIGIDFVKMKAVILEGLTHVGHVPTGIDSCRDLDALIQKMKLSGWVKDFFDVKNNYILSQYNR